MNRCDYITENEFSDDTATAATLEHELLFILVDNMQDNCTQSITDPPTDCIRAVGVLRYNRESDSHRLNMTTILPESPPLTEYPVKCEYCGEEARPSLDQTWLQEPETAPLFCCTQWQQLWKMLVKQRCLLDGRPDLRTGTPTALEIKPASEMEELHFQDPGIEDYKFISKLPSEFGILPELRDLDGYSNQLPRAETNAHTSKVFSFRLSCAPREGCWVVYPGSTSEKCLQTETEEVQELVPCFDYIAHPFGICHHQHGAEFQQKYYSNGIKFLTVFPDGSSQVFYPSGHLAVIVVVTDKNGKVCIVFDDSDGPDQTMRAVFQSDGRAACYHSNGNIWLSLNRTGGQCLNEAGARVRRWCWSSPTLLHPVFLSLNKTVGVRVLGKGQVFISFLARGQKAKFTVGSSCVQDESTDGSASGQSPIKDELLVQAARIKIHIVIQLLHQYLMKTTHNHLPKTTPAPHLNAAAQRLLEVSAHVVMSDKDRSFIQKCLQDCF